MIYIKYIKTNNVIVYSDGSIHAFHIERDMSGLYTTLYDKPFRLLNIDKADLSNEVLGYYEEGLFPYCKTEKDIFKLLRALQKKSKIKYYIENEL